MLGQRCLEQKIQKPLAILLKLYLENKRKEDDTKTPTGNYVTIAAFVTKGNLKTDIKHIHLTGDKHVGENAPS